MGRGYLSAYSGPLPFGLVGDHWSLSFFRLLSLISGSVVLWSYYYIDGDPYYRRFLSVVIAFVGSMVLLVFISTLYGRLVGWDGLGITSFLLVMYYKNRKALGRRLITAITNRVGDAFLLVWLGLTLSTGLGAHSALLILLVTAMTKRAQYPFRR